MIKNKENVLHSQLLAAAEIWDGVHQTPGPVDRWLGNYFHRYRKKFGSRDRRFLSETIYSAFRHKMLLETWVRKFQSGGNATGLFLLMAAASENLLSPDAFDYEISRSYPRIRNAASIYESLINRELPEKTDFSSFEEELALRLSFPLWLVKRWFARFGEEECNALLRVMQSRPPLVVRVNPVKITRDKLVQRFERLGLEVSKTPQSPFGIALKERINLFDTEEFRRGFFEIQDEGSQILCQKIHPKPGENIWDMCAGAGGKILLLAAIMENKGRVIATDIRIKKLEELKKRCRRAGIYNVFPAEIARLSETREARKGFDKILVDAPCSGTGTLRRNPDAKWKLKEEQLAVFHKEQTAILEQALPYLRKGGKIFYATCSLEPEENEQVVQEVLARHPELKLVPASSAKDGFLRLYPHKDQTDGFFLAVAENKG